MQFVEGAVYSQEPASGQEVQQLQEILGHSVDRLPFFVLVKRQQTALARLRGAGRVWTVNLPSPRHLATGRRRLGSGRRASGCGVGRSGVADVCGMAAGAPALVAERARRRSHGREPAVWRVIWHGV